MGIEPSCLRLLGLLLQGVECVAIDNVDDASNLLPRNHRVVFPFGSVRCLGNGLGVDTVERHCAKQQLFGCEIRNIVAMDGPKRTSKLQVERWGEELRRIGFRPVPLGDNLAVQDSLLLGCSIRKVYVGGGERVLEVGYKDLSLLTSSAW